MTEIYRFEDKGEWVRLDTPRLQWCWDYAIVARRQALAQRRVDIRARALGGRAVDEGQNIGIQAFGYIGEWATSQVLGIPDYVPRPGTYRMLPDLDPSVGVRSASVSRYGMWVRSRDASADIEVLVLLHDVPDKRPREDGAYAPGRALVVGWFPVAEAKRHDEWLRDFNTGMERAWVVPQSALRSMDALRWKLGRDGPITVAHQPEEWHPRPGYPPPPEYTCIRAGCGHMTGPAGIVCGWCRMAEDVSA